GTAAERIGPGVVAVLRDAAERVLGVGEQVLVRRVRGQRAGLQVAERVAEVDDRGCGTDAHRLVEARAADLERDGRPGVDPGEQGAAGFDLAQLDAEQGPLRVAGAALEAGAPERDR